MPALGPRNPYLMAGWASVAIAIVVGMYFTRIACEDPSEIAELEAIRDEAREELLELQRVANQLNVYRREIAELEAKVEEGLGAFAGEGPSAEYLSAMAGGARVLADREEEAGTWSISMSGVAGAAEAARTLENAAVRAPLMSVREVEVDGESWTAAARIAGVPAGEASAWQLKEYELPATTGRSKEEAEQLRMDIRRTQREMTQLISIIDPIVDLRRRAEDYRAYLGGQDRALAVGNASDLVGRLMAAGEAPLLGGRLVFGEEEVTVEAGVPAPGFSAGALGEALGEGWSVDELELGERVEFRVRLVGADGTSDPRLGADSDE